MTHPQSAETFAPEPTPDAPSSIAIDAVVASLREARTQWRDAHDRSREPTAREFPSRDALDRIFLRLKRALFPLRLGPAELRPEREDEFVARELQTVLQGLIEQIALELRHPASGPRRDEAETDAAARSLVTAFAASLSDTRRLIDADVTAAYRGDPAAHSVDEVLLCYPGVHAMIHHRLAHTLHELGLRLVPRIVAEIAHGQTGIDIHPGATIGPGFFIDHGTGVVIGETAVIGRDVRLYQAVTLGAKRFPAEADGTLRKGLPRHPIVEDEVVIYAGATLLGRIRIGRGAVIGGNVWITDDVPAGATVTQAGSVARVD